jgi:hypothetical protein
LKSTNKLVQQNFRISGMFIDGIIVESYDSCKHIRRKAALMGRFIHYFIIIACVILIYLLYNSGKGAIPFLILSAYFFILGFIDIYKIKNSKSN